MHLLFLSFLLTGATNTTTATQLQPGTAQTAAISVPETHWDNGFSWHDTNSGHRLALGFWVQMQHMNRFTTEDSREHAFLLRHARLNINGTFNKHWHFGFLT